MRPWLILVLVAVASPVSAQVWPGYPAASQADIHRYRMEQQRLRSAEQAAFARQQRLNTRLRLLEIEAARQPEPYIARTQTTAVTESSATDLATATARREAVTSGVGQIDAWLDRDPR